MSTAQDDSRPVERWRYLAEWEMALIEHPIREAYGPVVTDLRAAGFEVHPEILLGEAQTGSWSKGLSILARHLDRGGYPDLLMYRMARRFARPEGLPFWGLLEERYINPGGTGEQSGAAHALATIATPVHYDDLVRFIHMDQAEGRWEFVEPIVRFGGDAGVAVVTPLRGEFEYYVDRAVNKRKTATARARRYERAVKKLSEALATRREPVPDDGAIEWTTSLDLPDWKRLAKNLRTGLGGELDGPIGDALFAAILSAPLDDEHHVLTHTRLGVVQIGWFIDDISEVTAYIFGSQEVHDLCQGAVTNDR